MFILLFCVFLGVKRMFSPREMKQMTAKKYKNLPEVQRRVLDNKKKQINKANRLLANIFNKVTIDQSFEAIFFQLVGFSESTKPSSQRTA